MYICSPYWQAKESKACKVLIVCYGSHTSCFDPLNTLLLFATFFFFHYLFQIKVLYVM